MHAQLHPNARLFEVQGLNLVIRDLPRDMLEILHKVLCRHIENTRLDVEPSCIEHTLRKLA